ncbi:hypothetical protein M3152_16035 [Sporosarcina luteola]|uniref:hypothetical protein n=1 Tax=Sporosarcina luteola TaxID=582850 RepID=UPI00203C235A|nr:hypothetical protein [Sporosarcina luteola]MCM3639210.1 hypothetical protein [Sporosarcina luteola]
MANDNFEKRMEFLKKSYERVPTSFDPEEVFRKIDEESISRKNEQKKPTKHGVRQQITVWAMSIASIFIIGFIGTGYIIEQKQKSEEGTIETTLTDQVIEDLFKQYEEEREKRREMLKLDEVYFKHYASRADSTMNLLKNKSFLEMVRNGKDQTDLQEIYIQAIEELKLPSEMLVDLKQHNLAEDEKGSIRFLADYREKIQMLIEIYNQIIKENKEAVAAYEVDHSVDKAEIMMLSTKGFPEQLQNIIGTMREHSIRLYSEKYSGEIKTRYFNHFIYKDLNSRLHPNTSAYTTMISQEPYMFGPILEYPVLETSSIVTGMEYTLLEGEQNSSLYPVIKSYYITLFNEIMKGSEHTKIVDADGVLLPEYQEAWKNMAGGGQATPLRYILDPIIKEMEASGWRKSASWEALTYYDLEEALVLYREGVLEEYMYGERPDFQDVTIQLPNDSFEKEVQAIYTDFKKTYSKSILKGVSPVHVLGVFDYANEMDDPRTMYYLFNENTLKHNESGIDYTVDYYVDNWRKGLPFLRNATEVKFYKDKAYRHDMSFHTTLEFTGVDRAVSMVYSEEGIWELGTLWMDRLPMYDMSPERDFQTEVMDMSAFNYELLIGTDNVDNYLRWSQPLDVLGLYFYAGNNGFYEKQYELFYQGVDSEVVDKETYLENPEKYFLPYDDKMYRKASFQGLEQDEGGNWPGIATLTVDTELFPDLPSERKFHMVWTEDGWRVKFNPLEH